MLTLQAATDIVRAHVGPSLTVTAVRALTGGMVNAVVELLTDGEPASVVAKLAQGPDAGGFQWEFDSLTYFRRHTRLPVPRPYACFDGCGSFAGKGIVMAKVPGRHLGAARMTDPGRRRLQEELADLVADLHTHRREAYGPAYRPGETARWLDIFRPRLEGNYRDAREHLSAEARRAVERLLDDLDDRLPEFAEPTLTHGDLWANNIMVLDDDADRPRVAAFLDGHAQFAEVESELAYLRVFGAADEAFFQRYAEHHTLREGFDARCRIYWLNTMLLHLWLFGREYLPACERLAREAADPTA